MKALMIPDLLQLITFQSAAMHNTNITLLDAETQFISPEFSPLVMLGVSAKIVVLHFFATTSDILYVLVISILLSCSLCRMPLKAGESPRIRSMARSTSFKVSGGGPPPVLCSLCARAFSLAVNENLQ